MKKVMSLVLLVVVVLASLSFAACAGGTTPPPSGEGTTPPSGGETTPPLSEDGTPPLSEDGTPPPSEDGTPLPSEDETPPPSEGGFTWDDMPVYPVASQLARGSWAIPPEEGEWESVEWRHYETGDSQSNVITFYESAMPANGWQQIGEMQMEEVSWFFHTKNNEQDAAIVLIGTEEGETYISLMRAGN